MTFMLAPPLEKKIPIDFHIVFQEFLISDFPDFVEFHVLFPDFLTSEFLRFRRISGFFSLLNFEEFFKISKFFSPSWISKIFQDFNYPEFSLNFPE